MPTFHPLPCLISPAPLFTTVSPSATRFSDYPSVENLGGSSTWIRFPERNLGVSFDWATLTGRTENSTASTVIHRRPPSSTEVHRQRELRWRHVGLDRFYLIRSISAHLLRGRAAVDCRRTSTVIPADGGFRSKIVLYPPIQNIGG